MSEYLNDAKTCLDSAGHKFLEFEDSGKAYPREVAQLAYLEAEVHAAVAQAEALERIADALETFVKLFDLTLSKDAEEAQADIRIDLGSYFA